MLSDDIDAPLAINLGCVEESICSRDGSEPAVIRTASRIMFKKALGDQVPPPASDPDFSDVLVGSYLHSQPLFSISRLHRLQVMGR